MNYIFSLFINEIFLPKACCDVNILMSVPLCLQLLNRMNKINWWSIWRTIQILYNWKLPFGYIQILNWTNEKRTLRFDKKGFYFHLKKPNFSREVNELQHDRAFTINLQREQEALVVLELHTLLSSRFHFVWWTQRISGLGINPDVCWRVVYIYFNIQPHQLRLSDFRTKLTQWTPSSLS